ncbi:MAG: Hsp20/alpha crystallin family protein [Flavobacteriales bacterium]
MNLIKRRSDFFDTDPLDFPHRVFGSDLFVDRTFPLVNIRDFDKEFKVDVALPGYKRDDLKVAIADGVLSISSEQKEETKKNKDRWHRREFRYHSFERSLRLPGNADANSVKASFNHGVLSLSIAKKSDPKASRSKAIVIK